MRNKDNSNFNENTKLDLNVVLSNDYALALKYIKIGQYEEAAKLILNDGAKGWGEKQSCIDNQNLFIPLRNLITYRLAIKSNTLTLDGKYPLEFDYLRDKRVEAEVFLVNGIYYNSSRLFEKSMESFQRAKELYWELKWLDKYLICSYNTLITEINISQNLMTDNHFHKLMELQILADDCRDKRTLGLIARQKSYYFKEKLKWNAALHEAEMAVNFIEGRAFTSDYHLALLNVADCFIECGLWDKAHAFFEKILTPVDPRVQYPYYFIKERLNHNWTKQRLAELHVGPEVDPHFLYRSQLSLETETVNLKTKNDLGSLEIEPKYTWNRRKRILKFQNQEWAWSIGSKESILIDLLVVSSRTPDFIMSVLWPLYCEKKQLENRLYSLISRTNKKINSIIKFENGKYLIHGILSVE